MTGNVTISVPDQDPNPDPHVFGPPGSGSTSQKYGSGSGSGYGSYYHHAKIARQILIPWDFETLSDFLSLKNDVNVHSNSNLQKNFFIFFSFLLASWRSLMKIAGYGSGSISQRHRSADPHPDPHQNVMDPQHWLYLPQCVQYLAVVIVHKGRT